MTVTNEKLKALLRDPLLRVLAILLVAIMAGAEIGIGMELAAMLDVLGAEMFLFTFIVGVRMLPIWIIFDRLAGLLQRVDSYFFVPSAKQVAHCPGIVMHALPGFMPVCLAIVLRGVMPTGA